MSRIVYVNGRYLPHDRAGIGVLDRGFLFGDAVYEVCEVRDGRIIDEQRHLARLARSLGEIGIDLPMTEKALGRVLRETVRRNRVGYGMVFLQVSRGECARGRGREFTFPEAGTPPTVVATARAMSRAALEKRWATGIAVKTVPDNRWGRCDIKTAMLLAACLAKEQAKAEGAGEAWFVDETGLVTEGASTNAWIVTAEGALVTRPAGPEILRGTARMRLIDVLDREGLKLIERPFSVSEAQSAREAFVTSATSIVLPVVRIDDAPVGNGAPGLMAQRLRSVFHDLTVASDP
jgi:D-alanine transaminase